MQDSSKFSLMNLATFCLTLRSFRTSFSNKKVRYNFIRKVFLIVAIQLVVTFLMVLAAFRIESFKNFMLTNMWLLWVCLGILLVEEGIHLFAFQFAHLDKEVKVLFQSQP